MLNGVSRSDAFGVLFGKLKADASVTTQLGNSSAAAVLRNLLGTKHTVSAKPTAFVEQKTPCVDALQTAVGWPIATLKRLAGYRSNNRATSNRLRNEHAR